MKKKIKCKFSFRYKIWIMSKWIFRPKTNISNWKFVKKMINNPPVIFLTRIPDFFYSAHSLSIFYSILKIDGSICSEFPVLKHCFQKRLIRDHINLTKNYRKWSSFTKFPKSKIMGFIYPKCNFFHVSYIEQIIMIILVPSSFESDEK